MRGLVLSLFPGADLFGKAFEQAGFCVVRGPELILGGDVREFKAIAGKFDGVIGGPPCQAFSQAIYARGGAQGAVHGNLIPEFERVVSEAAPRWWVMEQVPKAPVPSGAVWSQVVDAWEFGSPAHRKRRFSSNLVIDLAVLPFEDRAVDPLPTITATEHKFSENSSVRTGRQRAGRKLGRRLTLEDVNRYMGLPEGFQTPGLLLECAYAVRGNGVPLWMGKAIAQGVIRALG